MEGKERRTPLLVPLAICFGLLSAGLMVLFASVSVSGAATLPNGISAKVNGPFSCSNNSGTTVIDAGGHVFEFSPTSIVVDKTVVAPLDSGVTSVEIDASYWTTSLRVNGNEVPLNR